MLGSQDTGPHGGGIGVIGVRIPTAEDDVIEIGQGHEFADQRIAVVGPLPEPNVTHLRERADRGRLAGASCEHTRVQGGGDCPHTGGEDSQPTGRR